MDLKTAIKKLYSDKKRLYIILAIGILILISGNLFPQDKTKGDVGNSGVIANINIEEEEKRLEKILSEVNGAGKTRVMITYDTSAEKIIAQNISINKNLSNTQKDSGGENEETDISEERNIVMSGSGSSQVPFVTKEIYPKIRGVVVVSEGADNTEIQYNIKNAVVAVLGVPYHKVQVLQKAE